MNRINQDEIDLDEIKPIFVEFIDKFNNECKGLDFFKTFNVSMTIGRNLSVNEWDFLDLMIITWLKKYRGFYSGIIITERPVLKVIVAKELKDFQEYPCII